MNNVLTLFLRLVFLLSLIAPPAFAAGMSTELSSLPPAAAESGPKTGTNKAIKRIHTEDAGSRIDELRVGGETQKISVQPKVDMPAYEVQPTDSGTAPKPTGANKRVWNVHKF